MSKEAIHALTELDKLIVDLSILARNIERGPTGEALATTIQALDDRIHNQTSLIDELNGKIAEKNEQIQALLRQHDNLSQHVNRLSDTESTLREQLSRAQNENESLRRVVKAQDEALAPYRQNPRHINVVVSAYDVNAAGGDARLVDEHVIPLHKAEVKK